MVAKKTTPKERAAARSKAKRGDQLKNSRAASARPGKTSKAGVGNIPMTVARGAVAVAKRLSKPKETEAQKFARIDRNMAAKAKRQEEYTSTSRAKLAKQVERNEVKSAKRASKEAAIKDKRIRKSKPIMTNVKRVQKDARRAR